MSTPCRRGTSPVKLGPGLKQLNDVRSRDYPFEDAMENYRQLVHILTTHDFESGANRSVSRHGPKLIQRAHHFIHRRIGPSRVRDWPDFIRSDQAGDPSILRHDETTPSASQEMLIGEGL